MEPERRKAFVEAAIAEIGEARSLDVTVAQIARRAGMSSGLAHHYFGDKEQMFLAAMRHILAVFSERVRTGLQPAKSPRDRLTALVRANFEDHVFDAGKTSAWLSFYSLSQSNTQAERLMTVYQRRLHSNLVYDLRKLTDRPHEVARAMGALIDGAYLRAALSRGAADSSAATPVLQVLEIYLGDSE